MGSRSRVARWIATVGLVSCLACAILPAPEAAVVAEDGDGRSIEDFLIHLEEELGVELESCGVPLERIQLCARPRIDVAMLNETVRAFPGLQNGVGLEDKKKSARLTFDVDGRDVSISLKKRKGTIEIQLAPLLPECDPVDVASYDWSQRLPRAVNEDPEVEDPELIDESRVQPRYPEYLRTARIPAAGVFGMAVIGTDGRVRNLCAARVTHPGVGLEAEFFAAVRRWRYRPARKSGKPVASKFAVLTEWTMFR